MADISIDPDIRIARTLPGRVYTDPAIFHRQRERVFARSWLYAAHDEVVKEPGQVHPFTLLDEPLLLTRDARGVHAMSNVWTHRGTIVVDSRPGHTEFTVTLPIDPGKL